MVASSWSETHTKRFFEQKDLEYLKNQGKMLILRRKHKSYKDDC